MWDGRHLTGPEPLDRARERCAADLAWLSATARRLRVPEPLPVQVSAQLTQPRDQLARELTSNSTGSPE